MLRIDYRILALTIFGICALDAPARAASCPQIPTTCVEAESGQLKLTKRRNRIPVLKWKAKALDVAMDALDDPITSETYSFCVYSGLDEQLLMNVDIDPGSNWKGGVNKYRYRDKTGTAGGINAINTEPGSLNDAQLLVKARGDDVLTLGFPFEAGQFPLLVQLANFDKGVCWETTFEVAHFVKNEVNRRGALRTSAVFKPLRCREDGGCAVERPLAGAALCRDRVASGGGMAKRMKIKLGDITRCRGREAVGKTDGECDPGLCPAEDPACAVLDTRLQSGMLRSIGHYETKLDLACDDVSVAAVQETEPGWGAPCDNAQTVDQLMDCLETGVWGQYGNTMGDAIFATGGVLDPDLLRCRKEIAKQTQKYSSKFNIILYSCRRAPLVRGRSCAEDPLITAQTIFENYVNKLRNSCTDDMIGRLEFGAPCEGSSSIEELTSCLGQLARDLGFLGVDIAYPEGNQRAAQDVIVQPE